VSDKLKLVDAIMRDEFKQLKQENGGIFQLKTNSVSRRRARFSDKQVIIENDESRQHF
jgi:hypothetical protein